MYLMNQVDLVLHLVLWVLANLFQQLIDLVHL